jgi:hypothetical protein
MTYTQRQFENFLRGTSTLNHIDFTSKSFQEKFKTMMKEDYNKHYSNVSFLTGKYGIEDLLKLRKDYG